MTELVYDFVLPLREVFSVERVFVKVVIHKELRNGIRRVTSNVLSLGRSSFS